MIKKFTRIYVRHYSDNGETKAYAEWVDNRGQTGRTHGRRTPLQRVAPLPARRTMFRHPHARSIRRSEAPGLASRKGELVMRILTWARMDEPAAHAITQAEYAAGARPADDYDDFVWQEQPSVEAAIARHDEAMDAYHDDVEKHGDMTQDVY